MARHPRAGAQRGRRWAHHGEESALSLCLPAACGAPGVCEHKAIRQEQRQCELTGTRHPCSNSGTSLCRSRQRLDPGSSFFFLATVTWHRSLLPRRRSWSTSTRENALPALCPFSGLPARYAASALLPARPSFVGSPALMPHRHLWHLTRPGVAQMAGREPQRRGGGGGHPCTYDTHPEQRGQHHHGA